MTSKQHDFDLQAIMIILLTSSQDVGGKQERFSVLTALTGIVRPYPANCEKHRAATVPVLALLVYQLL